jgi:hypothetical protein
VLLRDSRVIGYAGAGGFMFLGAYAYVSASPEVYEAYYGAARFRRQAVAGPRLDF